MPNSDLHIIWVPGRGYETFRFNKPQIFYSEGTRGSGKSTLIEYLAMRHLEHGACVLDLFGACDGESLAWLRSPYAENARILLLRGENVDVASAYPTKVADTLTLGDLDRYDLIISASPCYLSTDQEYASIGMLTRTLYRRFTWNRLVFMCVREASSLWYSRLMVSEKQSDIKSEAMYVLRQSRHLGYALGMDSLRFLGIDKDVRSNLDYLFIKSVGVEGLSDELKWLYSFFSPIWFRNMKPYQFVLLSRKGPLGCGWLKNVSWHKIEGENILKAVDIKIEYGEEVREGKYKGTFQTVGAQEHSQIVTLYIEGEGMKAIADKKERSTRTISEHVGKHNASIARSGFCPDCKQAGSIYYNKESKRGSGKLESQATA